MAITHARVKYVRENTQAFISVDEIREFKNNKPTDKHDFDRQKYYCHFYIDEKNPSGIYAPIQINELCNSDEIKQLKEKRATFSKLSDTALHDYETQDFSGSSNDSVDENRKDEKQLSQSNKDHGDEPINITSNVKEKVDLQKNAFNEKKMKELIDERLKLLGHVHYENDGTTNNQNNAEIELEMLKKKYDELTITSEKEKIALNNKIIEQSNIIVNLKHELLEEKEKLISYKALQQKLTDISSTPVKGSAAKRKLFEGSPTDSSKKRKISPIIASSKSITTVKQWIDDNFDIATNASYNEEVDIRNENKEITDFTETHELSQQKSMRRSDKNLSMDEIHCLKDSNINNKEREIPKEQKGKDLERTKENEKEKVENNGNIKDLKKKKEKENKNQEHASSLRNINNETGMQNQEENGLEKSNEDSNKKEISNDEKNNKSQKKKKNKKSKKKHTKKKKVDSDEEYKSDSFDVDNKMENNKQWTKEEDGKKIKMYHLRLGISISYEAWKDLRKEKKPTIYLRKLARAIWGTHDLMNRAVKLEKTKQRLLNRSPRKTLTPVKKAVLRKCFFEYLQTFVTVKKERDVHKKKWKSYLSIYINYLIESELNHQKENDSNSSSSSDSSSSSSDSDD